MLIFTSVPVLLPYLMTLENLVIVSPATIV